jgi:hypothetical protein
MVERTQKAVSSTGEALAVYRGSMRKAADDMQAVSASASIRTRAASEVGSAWMNWAGAAARTNVEASQRLMQCRTFQEVAEAQREYLTGTMRNLMERNAKVLEVSQRSFQQARGPLDARLNEAA